MAFLPLHIYSQEKNQNLTLFLKKTTVYLQFLHPAMVLGTGERYETTEKVEF